MKKLQDFKIVFAGSGGTGKSTLMEAYSNKHGVPIARVETKSMMPVGIRSHLDIIRMATHSPAEGVKFQKDIIEARTNLFVEHTGGLVSDRSVVDSYAYYSVHNSMFAEDGLDFELMKLTAKSLMHTDITFLLKPDLSLLGVPDNNVRLRSLAYYEAISSVILSTMRDIVSNDVILHHSIAIPNSELIVDLACTPYTTVAILNESKYSNGIATVEDRLLAVEATIEFVTHYRESLKTIS